MSSLHQQADLLHVAIKLYQKTCDFLIKLVGLYLAALFTLGQAVISFDSSLLMMFFFSFPPGDRCQLKAAFTRQTKVGKLVLANSSWYV